MENWLKYFHDLFVLLKIQGNHLKQVILLTSVIGDKRILSWEGKRERLLNEHHLLNIISHAKRVTQQQLSDG